MQVVKGNGTVPIDEIKVRAAVALCDELRRLTADDPQYAVMLRRLQDHWRTLSPVEQDTVDEIFQRVLARLKG